MSLSQAVEDNSLQAWFHVNTSVYCISMACSTFLMMGKLKYVVQILWTGSIYLEAVAILPQLVLLQRSSNIDNLTGTYVFLLGFVHFCFLAHFLSLIDDELFRKKLLLFSLFQWNHYGFHFFPCGCFFDNLVNLFLELYNFLQFSPVQSISCWTLPFSRNRCLVVAHASWAWLCLSGDLRKFLEIYKRIWPVLQKWREQLFSTWSWRIESCWLNQTVISGLASSILSSSQVVLH